MVRVIYLTVVCCLTPLFLTLSGCLSDEEPVPKYDYGKSAEQPKGEQDKQWTYEEYQANSAAIAFAKKDLDGDGTWNVDEFRQADMSKASPEWGHQVFEIMDKNGDGRMSREEQSSRTSEVWHMLMDGNENGTVSEEEYTRFDSWLIETGHCGTIFRLMDRDGDGSMTPAEFGNQPPDVEFYKQDSDGDNALTPAEFVSRSRTEAEIVANTKAFQSKDFDGDGAMSLEEYLTSPREADLRRLDSDGDGALSLAEYGKLEEVGSSAAYAERIFRSRDTNGDGKLSIDELHADSQTIDFAQKDLDGDGTWNVDEFHQSDMPKASPQWARRTFEMMDKNGDGRMDLAEQRSRTWFMFIDADESDGITEAEYGDFHPPLVKAGHGKTVFNLMDKNQDGAIDRAEYDARPAEVEFLKNDRSGDSVLSLEEFLDSSKSKEEIATNTKVFHDKDSDRDGQLSVDEYMTAPAEGRFRGLDSDGDGALTVTEYAAADEASGTEAFGQKLFEARDRNGDGKLDMDELHGSSRVIDFAKKDTDGDGSWNVAEFQQADMPKASVGWAQRTFEMMDKNGDGKMSAEEQANLAWFMFFDADENEGVSEAEYGLVDQWLVESGHLRTVFGLMDRNGDGTMSEAEYKSKPPEVEFFKEDRNGDSRLTLEEFLEPTKGEGKVAAATQTFHDKDFDGDAALTLEEYLASAEQNRFQRLDSDRDGMLSLAEYGSAEDAAGAPSLAARLFKARDVDGNGKLGFEEFCANSPAIDFARRDTDGDAALTEEEYLAGRTDEKVIALERDLFRLRDGDSDERLASKEFQSNSPAVAFRTKDTDGDGSLDRSEFHQAEMAGASSEWVQNTFGVTDQDGNERISIEELQQRPSKAWFAWMDADLDDRLSREEFAEKNASFVTSGRLEPLFVLMDANGDGVTSVEEYCLNSEEVSFIRRDNNGDGKLDFSEFTAWMGEGGQTPEAREDFDRRDLDKDDLLSFPESAVRPEDLDFWAFDRDNNARLSIQEFRLSGAAPGGSATDRQDGANEQPTDQTARPRDSKAWQNFFGSVDANRDEQITLDEFKRQAPKWRFIRLDVDIDGFVTPVDFAQVEGIPDLGGQMAALIVGKDADTDGKLTAEEFVGKAN